jgi:ribosome maturation factor RimP
LSNRGVGEEPTFLLVGNPVYGKMPAAEKNGPLERVTELAERAATGTGIEIIEVQLRGGGNARLLRVYIDKTGGVTHGDCELISEKFGALLDAEDPIPGDSYRLEVSSPGVERKLARPRDFERVVGQKVRLSLREPVAGLKSLDGTLVAFAAETLEVETASGQKLQVPLERVAKANTKFDW